MARNKYAATCIYCHKIVAAHTGVVDRSMGFAKVIHVECLTKRRAEKAQNGIHKRL